MKKHKAVTYGGFLIWKLADALLGCPKCERGRLGKLERTAQFSEGEMSVPYMYVNGAQRGGSEASTLRKRNKGRADQDRGEGSGDSHRFRHHWGNNRMAQK
jgi:hypothetical protein